MVGVIGAFGASGVFAISGAFGVSWVFGASGGSGAFGAFGATTGASLVICLALIRAAVLFLTFSSARTWRKPAAKFLLLIFSIFILTVLNIVIRLCLIV